MDPRTLPVLVNSVHMVRRNLDIFYPQAMGMKDTNVQQRINKEILNLLNKMIKDVGYYENPQTTITGTFEIKVNERNILSLSLIEYAYSGGAHGITPVESLTFDVSTGKSYELKDLFKPGSDYVKVLSENVAKQIKERDIPTLEEFKGIKPDQDYYIGDKDLVIYFQQYELAPYAWGHPDFPIVVYEISDIIKEDGPLGKMMGGF